MKRLLILLIAVATMTLGVITISEEQTGNRFRVQVNVAGKESIKGLVTSYINRELRSLRDVEIVYNNPDWELDIVALEVFTESSRKIIGVALSTIILRKFNHQFLVRLLPKSYRETVTHQTSGLYNFPGHNLRMGATDDLREICNEIVADFDTDYLEKERKSKKH